LGTIPLSNPQPARRLHGNDQEICSIVLHSQTHAN
jgi:hypothetical protein